MGAWTCASRRVRVEAELAGGICAIGNAVSLGADFADLAPDLRHAYNAGQQILFGIYASMDHQHLLQCLADGEFHSGAALGRQLGVSRTAVWKALKRLPEWGVELESRHGLGYRIAGGMDLLDEAALRAGLDAGISTQIDHFEVLQITDSTNRVALDYVVASPGKCGVFLAEAQQAGKGRRGRSWVSPYGRSLYLSVTRHFVGGVANLEGLSLAVGVSLCRALQRLGIQGVGLKWPNDLVAGGAKLGGILIELTGDLDGPCDAIIGIGVNVTVTPAVAGRIDQAWTDLSALSTAPVSRTALAAAVISELFAALAEFSVSGFAAFRGEWQRHDAWQGRKANLHIGSDVVQGFIDGVSATGALRLRTTRGVEEFHGGELSLRSAR